jgi:hypothetical protein
MRALFSLVLTVVACAALAGIAPAQSGRARRASATPRPAVEAAVPDNPADNVSPAPAPSAVVKPAPPASTIPIKASYPARYKGGSLGLKDDERITVTVKDGTFGIGKKGASFAVGVDKVTSITYAQRTRSRLAEGISVGVLNPTAGGVLGRSQSTAHFIEILWEGSAAGGAVLRVDKDDYQGLLAALEGATGLEARMELNPPTRDWQ